VLSFLFAATFWRYSAARATTCSGVRLAGRTGALSRSARIQLIALVGMLMLLKCALDGPYELLSHTGRQAVHRCRLHRHQRRVAGQADPDGDRGDLRVGGVLACVARLAVLRSAWCCCC
jgi:hypothetical protein